MPTLTTRRFWLSAPSLRSCTASSRPRPTRQPKKVRAAGGLYILGTERHESRRIDNQLRGRSGRQGDPGETQFYLSLEDDLMRLFGSERIQNMMDTSALPMTSRSTRRFCPARSKMPRRRSNPATSAFVSTFSSTMTY